MKRFLAIGAAALLLGGAAGGTLMHGEIARLLAVNSLFSEDRIVANFTGMADLFHSVTVERGTGPASALDYSELPFEPDSALRDWIADRQVTAMIVLRDGEIAYEEYFHGTGPDDLRISWSIAKSFVSSLIGILIEEGAIGSVEDPVVAYAPALAGSAYDGASIEDVLQMESGVVFDEDYMDFWSDINRMGRVLALGGSMDAFAAGHRERDAEPGTHWRYVSIDTHVLSMVARGATGQSLAELLSRRIIRPLGLEAAPVLLTDSEGTGFALGGLNMTARDYARFGRMIAQGGRSNGRQIVPEDWIDRATVASARTGAGRIGYGYQWWIADGWPEGVFTGQGIYGQYLYVNRLTGVVIYVAAAHRAFREPGKSDADRAMLHRIGTALGDDASG